MRLLIVHQYFKAPEEGSGIRSWYLAKAFQSAGHEVQVLSAHNSKIGPHNIDGIAVHYFRIRYSNLYGFFRRAKAFYQFVVACQGFLKKDHAYDLLYLLSTPLTTGWVGMHAKKRYRLPYLFEVGDLWPLAPIQLGGIKNAWLMRFLYTFEEKIYNNAQLLAGLSPEIKQAMEYTVSYAKKVEVLPNMADCNFFEPCPDLYEAFSPESPLVIGYQGAIGRANHLEYLIDFAQEALQQNLPIQIRIMGEGSEKERIKKTSRAISNILWVPSGGKACVRSELKHCHVSYISYASYPVLETGSPNKFYDGLAAGKLIMLNFGGWMSRLIQEHECGISYNCAKPAEGVAQILPFLSSPSLLSAYQQNARELAEVSFDVPVITQRAIDLIEKSGSVIN